MSHSAPLSHPNSCRHLHHQHRQNHLLFSFTSKTRPFHSFTTSLHFKQPLLSFSSSLSSQQPCLRVTRVSTAPVEYAPPPPDFNFNHEISRLKKLRSKLGASKSIKKKLSVVDDDCRVKQFFDRRKNHNNLARFLSSLSLGSFQLYLIKCLIAAGQEHVLNYGMEYVDSEVQSVRSEVKSALYALVEMIERWDIQGGQSEVLDNRTGSLLENEQVKDLNMLLKSLAAIEQFYDCIGGIIG